MKGKTRRTFSKSLCLLFLFFSNCELCAADFQPAQLDQGIYFGAAPSDVADYENLRQLGVTRIIDLRSFKNRAMADEMRLARRYGICYQPIAIGFTPRFPDSSVEAVMQELRCPKKDGAVYVHCTLGRDRAGLVVALYRQRYMGWKPDAAFCEKKAHEFNGLLVHLDRYFWESVSH